MMNSFYSDPKYTDKAIDDAIMDSSDAHKNQMMQLLSDPKKAANFSRIIFDLLKSSE